MSEHEAVRTALPHPPLKTGVKTSWHVDKASFHIDIQHLFQNLSLEIGLQTSHNIVFTSQQKATHTHTRTHTHTHKRTHPHTNTHTHRHTHTHTHTHTNKYTHTKTQTHTDV